MVMAGNMILDMFKERKMDALALSETKMKGRENENGRVKE